MHYIIADFSDFCKRKRTHRNPGASALYLGNATWLQVFKRLPVDSFKWHACSFCTAHNVMLMDEDLRRDQIYFTCKDSMGRSSIISLADYKGVRKNDLFSKKYLAGFFTDLPDLGISN